VVGNEIDRFVPIANTLLHFHPYGDGRMVLGGAFGVGIPLSSSDAGRSPTFLLGPSLIMGDRDKVFITGGIIGGQVNRLGAGIQEGDTFTFTDGTLETRGQYELGYFLSLSFKLFGK
jgi:hypothetical protein